MALTRSYKYNIIIKQLQQRTSKINLTYIAFSVTVKASKSFPVCYYLLLLLLRKPIATVLVVEIIINRKTRGTLACVCDLH